eukprot:5164541-Pyramimonas_sp.AAC.1
MKSTGVAFLWPLGDPLGASFGLLWASAGLLGVSWAPAGGLGGPLGAEGSECQFELLLLGPSWGPVGALLGHLGRLLGCLGTLFG